MDYLIFLLLLFGITYCEESTPNVTIIWEAESLKLKYNPPILFKKRQFKIIVESKPINAEDHFGIVCHLENNRKVFINETLIKDTNRYFAKENHAKKWHCRVTRKSNAIKEDSRHITFSAHIRLRTPGEIRVNDRNIPLNSTDLSVSDYDAFGTYNYVKGELAKFTCHKLYYNYQTFIFNLSDGEHKTGYSSDVNLYLKLGHELSPNYIDCKIHKTGFANYIRLLLKPVAEIEFPQLQVNGLTLTPSKKDSDHNYVFVYEYYPGENLTLINNLDKSYESMECNASHIPGKIMLKRYEKTVIRTHPVLHPPASMNCSLVKEKSLFFPNAEDVRISIKFIEDSMKFSPNIIGIQWSKTIAKYYDDVKNKNGTIYASYNSNDNTTLHCSYNKTGVKWYYDTRVNSTLLTATQFESEYTTNENQYSSSRTFQLIENVNRTTLKCSIYNSETSKVVLIRQKELIQQVNSTENTEPHTDVDETTTNNYSKSTKETEPDDTGKRFLPLKIGVISIIIILLVTILIVYISCKRKKLPKTDIDINYENLPAHNEGTMPLPPQWDTKRIKNDNIEDAYAKVIPKSQRTKLVDINSEPLSKIENSCYAIPYDANLESPYAEIIPQPQGNGNVSIEPENVVNYAQIVPKALRNVAKNQVLPTNDDYTKNGTKMRNRLDTDKHKYANVFNSEMYANVSSSGC